MACLPVVELTAVRSQGLRVERGTDFFLLITGGVVGRFDGWVGTQEKVAFDKTTWGIYCLPNVQMYPAKKMAN